MKKQITKSYLEYLGVTEVTQDGKIFTQKGEIKPTFSGNGTRPNEQRRYEFRIQKNGERARVLVHHAVYAWFNSEVPYGKEIHHIDGNHLNNSKNNLLALTPEEHRKEHRKLRELKCRLDIPRSWYQKQLDELEAIENKTKVNYDKISIYRAKLRYYDSHIDEAIDLIEFKKDCMELAVWKQAFKENNKKKLWHECCTIEKMVKEKGIEARSVVTHALEVAHRYFGKEISNGNLVL